MKRLLIGLCLFCVSAWAFADYLVLKRNANVYKEASRDSEIIKHIKPSDVEGPYTLKLVDTDRKNGYYHIKIRGSRKAGWVYKSLVRRYKDEPQRVAYKRKLYRHWIDADGDCQNTRAEALIRDATGKVKFKTNRKCRVVSGKWKGPYTGKTFTKAKEVDVDHLVPLKNAHESGAWAWSKQRRKEYANYMRDRNHLLTVSASENRKKGAKGPDKYMPPNQRYHCEYVRIWVKIKRDWELEMTETEGQKVEGVLQGCR